jgi:hypothetical protein
MSRKQARPAPTAEQFIELGRSLPPEELERLVQMIGLREDWLPGLVLVGANLLRGFGVAMGNTLDRATTAECSLSRADRGEEEVRRDMKARGRTARQIGQARGVTRGAILKQQQRQKKRRPTISGQ